MRRLRRYGIKISNGTIVDAAIIGAPSSTKNKDRERDPEMHQRTKGEQWYFGMKAHSCHVAQATAVRRGGGGRFNDVVSG